MGKTGGEIARSLFTVELKHNESFPTKQNKFFLNLDIGEHQLITIFHWNLTLTGLLFAIAW